MNIDVIQIGALCGAILSILGLWAFVVNPFKTAMQKNEDTMSALKDTIKELAYELKDSQRDRENNFGYTRATTRKDGRRHHRQQRTDKNII